MSETLIGQIITAIVTLGLALIGYLKLRMGQKTVEGKVETYSKQVDGMKTELVEAVRGRAQSEGEQKGAADNQAITDAKSGTLTPTVKKEGDTSVTPKDAEIIATTVVDTVKADPEIEVKKTTKPKTK